MQVLTTTLRLLARRSIHGLLRPFRANVDGRRHLGSTLVKGGDVPPKPLPSLLPRGRRRERTTHAQREHLRSARLGARGARAADELRAVRHRRHRRLLRARWRRRGL